MVDVKTPTCPHCGNAAMIILCHKHNHSRNAKPRGEYHESRWSLIACFNCGKEWRAKGAFIARLKNISPSGCYADLPWDNMELHNLRLAKIEYTGWKKERFEKSGVKRNESIR